MTVYLAVTADNKKKKNQNCIDMLLHENEEKNKK